MTLNPIPFGNNCPTAVGKEKIIIAGPCSAETEEQVMTTARALASFGVQVFRAGIWKPRTRPGHFEGVGAEGLKWLSHVQRETGMKVMVEVGGRHHAELAMENGVDAVWLGARTSANPFAVQSIAEALKGSDVPVFVKNPINADLDLWIGALERLERAGISHLAAIHRGFSAYEHTIYRNPPQWQIPIELRRRVPGIPIICDPSHICGRRDLVAAVCQHAMNLAFDGLMVESHCRPDEAWSDAAQQLTPIDLAAILSALQPRSAEPNASLFASCREHLDKLDTALIDILAERMAVSREMGGLKREHDLMVLQSDRYNAVLNTIAAEGQQKGLDPEFLKKIFELIHAESIAQQL